MRLAKFTCCAFLLTLSAFSCRLRGEKGEPGFKRFPETISPNGAYVLAWGWCKDGNLAGLKEWAKGKDNGGGEIENYLVDALHGRVLARIPDLTFCRSTPGQPPADYHTESHYSLEVCWSSDSREVLACYDEYWEGNEVVLIRPATHTFINVKDALNDAYFKEKHRDPWKTFHVESPAALGDGIFAIHGWAQLGFKEQGKFFYRLRIRINLAGKTPRVKIIDKQKLSRGTDQEYDDKPNKLEARLDKLNDQLYRRTSKMKWTIGCTGESRSYFTSNSVAGYVSSGEEMGARFI